MGKASGHDPIPPLEWAAAAAGALIALTLLLAVGREAVFGNSDAVPILSAKVIGVHETPQGHVVEIRVSNGSSRTGAEVKIEGKAGNERREATIDYVPGRSQAEAGLIFPERPHGLTVEVVSYQVP
jgi:uncharacterized protein (TIGR02588 family)